MIVIGAATKDPVALATTRRSHEAWPAVPGLTQEQYALIFQYLVEAFSGKPAPEMPDDWLADWVYYR